MKLSKQVTALAQWFGGDRMICPRIAELLTGCEWVGIPFAGGMSAIKSIRARTIVANDLHRGIICLADAVKRPELCKTIQSELRALLFHPDTLAAAQHRFFGGTADNPIQIAIDYFVIAWMTRSGVAGTKSEKTAGLSIRWEAGGGDSAKRYHSAIDALMEWSTEFQRCTFQRLDCLDFLLRCLDKLKHGLYIDPPFFGPGEKYLYNFSESQWRRLAAELAGFTKTVVIVRCYDIPMMRELFPEERWIWHCFEGRTQTNAAAPEVLIESRRG
jgi:DNA adenine methylase